MANRTSRKYEKNCQELVDEAAQFIDEYIPEHPNAASVREEIKSFAEHSRRHASTEWKRAFFGVSIDDRVMVFSFTDYSNVLKKERISDTKIQAKMMSREIDEIEEDFIDLFLEWNKPHFREIAARAFVAWMFERVDFSVMADRYLDFVNWTPPKTCASSENG